MLPTELNAPHPSLFASVEEMNHFATSSLNSIEYLTAVSIGIARDYCRSASEKGMPPFAVTAPWDSSYSMSASAHSLLADSGKQFGQLNDIVHDYFEYVDTYLRRAR